MRFVVVGRHAGVEVVRLANQLGLTELTPAGMLNRYPAHEPPHLPGSRDSRSVERPITPTVVRTVIAETLSAARVPDRWILERFPHTVDDAHWLATLLLRLHTPLTAALVADAPRGDSGEHAALVAVYGRLAVPLSGFLA